MSIRAIQAVWDRSTVGGSMRLLLLALADFADEEGYSWPSVATLSKRTARSERHVQRLLTAAVDVGELRAEREGGITTSRYWLTPGGVPMERGDADVTPPRRGRHPRGDADVTGGVTRASPEPSSNGHSTVNEPGIWNGRMLHDGSHPNCAVCAPLRTKA